MGYNEVRSYQPSSEPDFTAAGLSFDMSVHADTNGHQRSKLEYFGR